MIIQDTGGLTPGAPGTLPSQAPSQGADQAVDAFGLQFESLLQIVLTQLTYQDPLKPVENYEFVSQLAQFSQIQQTQTMSDRLESILRTEATGQATSLLGRVVDIPAGNTVLSGRVSSVSFSSGEPRITIVTEDDQTISNVSLASVTQVREGE